MAHVNPASKAFRRGFLDGFTAYYLYFNGRKYPRARSIDPSVRSAWLAVGDALKSAEDIERGNIGKSTGKAGKECIST
jgi:hypothetical protein